MKMVAIGLLCAALLAGLFYGSFLFKRWWHYKWGYESSVKYTICEVVKTDSLKDPNYCK